MNNIVPDGAQLCLLLPEVTLAPRTYSKYRNFHPWFTCFLMPQIYSETTPCLVEITHKKFSENSSIRWPPKIGDCHRGSETVSYVTNISPGAWGQALLQLSDHPESTFADCATLLPVLRTSYLLSFVYDIATVQNSRKIVARHLSQVGEMSWFHSTLYRIVTSLARDIRNGHYRSM